MKPDADSVQPVSYHADRLVLLTAVLAIVAGGLVLVGWALDIAVLKSVLPNWVSMKPNAASAFVLIGTALLFAFHRLPLLSRLARVCGWLAGLIGLLTLIEYCGGLIPGFDQWLFPEPVGTVGTFHPGRMAPDTALCFLLLAAGLEIAYVARQRRRIFIASAVFGMSTLVLALVEILSYFMPSLRTNGWWGLTMMALPTATLLALLGMTILLTARRKIQWIADSSAPNMEAVNEHMGLNFLTAFILLATGILSAGAFYCRNYEQHYRAQMEQQLSVIADLKADELIQWRRERLADGTLFFRNADFSKSVRQLLDNPGDTSAQKDVHSWLAGLYLSGEYDQVRLLTTNGIPLLAASTNQLPVSSFVLKCIPEALRSGQMTLVDFHRHPFDQNIYLTLIVPVFDETDHSRPLGVVTMRINPQTFVYPFVQRWPTLSSSAEALLVRREGSEAVFLNELRFQTNTALNLRMPLTQITAPAAHAALGENGVMEGVDYRGVSVLAAIRTISNTPPWALVARMDTAEAFAPIRREKWKILILIGCLLLSAGTGLGLVWRQQHIRAYREKIKTTDALRKSEEQLLLVLEGSQTGIWDWDIKTGRVQRNKYYVEMLGYTLAEYNNSHKHWLAFVHPGDLLDAQKAMQDHLEGRLPTYRVEYRMRHKNGEYRWILDQAKIVKRDPHGKPLRVTGTHIDITERKQSEIALQKSEEKFRHLFHNAEVGMFRSRLDGTEFLESNDKYLSILGRTREETIGGPSSIVWADPKAREQMVRALRSQGHVDNLECQLVRKDGTVIDCITSLRLDSEQEVLEGTIMDITARKQVEERLLNITKAVESASDAIGISDAQGRHFYQNRALSNLFGYATAEELQAAGGGQAVVKDPKIGREIFDSIMHGRSWIGEVEMVTKDGRVFSAFERADAITDDHGKIIGLVGVITDITARKQAIEELRESERFLKEVQDIASLGSYVLDIADGRWKSSEVLDNVLGISPAYEHSVEGWANLVHPDDRAMMATYFQEHVLGRGQPFAKEYRIIRHNDGAERWVYGRGRLEFDPQGRPVRMKGSIHDITERKQTAERDHLAHAVLQRLNQHSNPADMIRDIITLIKKSTGFDAVGLRLREGDDFPYYSQSGFSDDFLKVENTLIVRDEKGGVCANKDGGICLGCICGVVLSGKTDPANPLFSDGGSAWTNNSLSLLDIPAGQNPQLHPRRCVDDGYLSVALIPLRAGVETLGLLQLNDRRANRLSPEMVRFFESLATSIAIALKRTQTEASLAMAHQTLQELQTNQMHMVQQARLSVLGQLASGIAHDFNNALMPVVGYAELLLSHPEYLNDHEKALHFIDMIFRAAEDARKVVSRIRLIHQTENTSVFVPMDVDEVVREAIALTSPRWKTELRAAGVAIRMETHLGAEALVMGDESQLREALTNLILNAADAMPQGGVITFATAVEAGDVVLSITDTGVGMTEAVKAHCMEAFYTTKGAEGSGLGLAMVAGIVGRHKGTVEIDSAPGRGTTIRLRLPAVTTDAQVANVAAGQAASHTLSGLRILLAEDDSLVLGVLEQYLIINGHIVERAQDGREALDKISAGTFDLVITDRSMPKASGDEVARAAKARNPATPVILLTGFGDLMHDASERPSGVDLIQSKPITIEELQQAIRKVMTRHAPS